MLVSLRDPNSPKKKSPARRNSLPSNFVAPKHSNNHATKARNTPLEDITNENKNVQSSYAINETQELLKAIQATTEVKIMKSFLKLLLFSIFEVMCYVDSHDMFFLRRHFQISN
jgi:hypothetical protein